MFIIKRDTECTEMKRIYVCLPFFKKRYIFEDGKYVGWYRP